MVVPVQTWSADFKNRTNFSKTKYSKSCKLVKIMHWIEDCAKYSKVGLSLRGEKLSLKRLELCRTEVGESLGSRNIFCLLVPYDAKLPSWVKEGLLDRCYCGKKFKFTNIDFCGSASIMFIIAMINELLWLCNYLIPISSNSPVHYNNQISLFPKNVYISYKIYL